VIDLGRSCSRHRPTLLDFVDHGEVGDRTAAALAHLDRCRRCTDAVQDALLTITALRRLSEDAAAREPSPDAWPRLRLRIESWPRRPAIASPLLGVAMSFGIVAVLALPFRLTTLTIGNDPTPTYLIGHASPEERRAETAYIAASRRATPTGSAPSTGNVRANLPAEILEVRWKEAHACKSSARPPEPI
jgi:hypothetical protein